MAWVLPVYGIGLLVPAFTQSIAVLVPVMLIAGFGGGLVMTLPYALLQPLMPRGRHGVLTGFYSLSRGIGTALGPLLGALVFVLVQQFLLGSYTELYLGLYGALLVAIILFEPLGLSGLGLRCVRYLRRGRTPATAGGAP
jgi:MFS family permease